MPYKNSYAYMHNHEVLNDKANETGINNWNCRSRDTCPLPNSCQTKRIISQANIDCDIAGYKQKYYLGSCETTFKDRFGNHKKLVNKIKHKKDIKRTLENQKAQLNTKNYVENYLNMLFLQSKQ